MLARLDALAEAWSTPGFAATRSDVLRVLVTKGLTAMAPLLPMTAQEIAEHDAELAAEELARRAKRVANGLPVSTAPLPGEGVAGPDGAAP